MIVHPYLPLSDRGWNHFVGRSLMVMAVVISNCVASQHYENPSELTGTVELRSELV